MKSVGWAMAGFSGTESRTSTSLIVSARVPCNLRRVSTRFHAPSRTLPFDLIDGKP